jgi:class 3 adenylate cyclase
MNLSRSATFAYDLAKQPDGYLVFYDEVIETLRDHGLVTTKEVGDGFVIAKAVPEPLPAAPPGYRRWGLHFRPVERGASL